MHVIVCTQKTEHTVESPKGACLSRKDDVIHEILAVRRRIFWQVVFFLNILLMDPFTLYE